MRSICCCIQAADFIYKIDKQQPPHMCQLNENQRMIVFMDNTLTFSEKQFCRITYREFSTIIAILSAKGSRGHLTAKRSLLTQ